GEVLPRVFLGRLERQRDTLAVHVDVEHLDGDLVADLHDLGRVVDVLPRQLGDVHQAVDAAEVHERTEVDDRGHDALADLALLELGQEALAHLGLGLLEPGAARQHDVVAVLVELDDLRLERLADGGLQVAHAAHLHQRRGQEAAQADVEDQAALDDLDDRAFDDAVLLLDLLDGAPGALVLGALLGQDQPAFLVLLLEDQGLDLVADLDDLVRVDVVLDRQLTRGDDALGLVADVEQDLVPVDLHDGALDDVAIVEVLDGLVDCGEEVFLGADVVDGHLGRVDLREVGGAARHRGMGTFEWMGLSRARRKPVSLPQGPALTHGGEIASRCPLRPGRGQTSGAPRVYAGPPACVQPAGTPCRSPVSAIARSRSAARSATGFSPAREARSTRAQRSAARARSSTSARVPPRRSHHTASTPSTYAGWRSKRSRLPRSVDGCPAWANSQSSTPVTCRVSASTRRFFGFRSEWTTQVRPTVSSSAWACAATVPSRVSRGSSQPSA